MAAMVAGTERDGQSRAGARSASRQNADGAKTSGSDSIAPAAGVTLGGRGLDPPEKETIDALIPPSLMLEQFEQFTQWLFGHVLGWANIIQIPALVLTAGIAWLLCRPVRAWLTGRLNQVRTSSHHDWLAQHHTWVIDRLIPLITPIAWVTGLWISVSVAEQAGWPHEAAQIAINLVLAWLVIRLAADVVPNAALAQLIAVLAWVVAALNIVHLLGPTLDLLDRAAIVIGGLRSLLADSRQGRPVTDRFALGCNRRIGVVRTPNDPRV